MKAIADRWLVPDVMDLRGRSSYGVSVLMAMGNRVSALEEWIYVCPFDVSIWEHVYWNLLENEVTPCHLFIYIFASAWGCCTAFELFKNDNLFIL